MKKKKNKIISLPTLIFYIFIISILSLSIGYSAQSSSLSIDGSIIARKSEDVRITNVSLNNELTNSATQVEPSTFTSNTMSASVKLSSSSDSVIYYDITVTNLSSYDVLVTDVTLTNNSNVNTEYVLNNLVINETKIPAASTYTFQIGFEFKDNVVSKFLGFTEELISSILGISMNASYTAQFTFYKIPQYSLEINANPEDSLINFMVDGVIIASGNGNLRYLFNENTEVTYTISSSKGSKEGTVKMTENISKTINLDSDVKYNFTIIPTPSDSVVTINIGDTLCVTGNGSQTCSASTDMDLSYTVERPEYKSASGTYTITDEDYTLNVNLAELEWLPSQIDNSDSSSSTTNAEALVVNHEGYYLIDVYGGAGAKQYYYDNTSTGNGGAAGHVYGVVHLDIGDKLYYSIGGNAQVGTSSLALSSSKSKPGANGGGQADQRISGSGGGYTAVFLNITSSSLSLTNVESGNVLFIAAGGGGASGPTKKSVKAGEGGAGGSNDSVMTELSYGYVFAGSDGTIYSGTSTTYIGKGATTSGGVCSANTDSNGSIFQGGTSKDRGGGGGAGFYGGAGGAGSGSSDSGTKVAGGGGGGSSFISNKVTFQNLSSDILSKVSSSNPSQTGTGGSIKITFIGKTL